MYVSIDMDNLVFLHKHADHEVVSAISWMEIGVHRSTRVTATDKARFLKTLTDLELKMLYKNTTGAQLAGDDPVTLRYQLASAVKLLSSTRAVREEVLAQLALVDDRVHAGETFKYAYGARTPAQPQELFPLRGRPLSADELRNAADWARSDLPKLTANAPTGPWPERAEPQDDEVPPAPPQDDAPPAPPVVKKAKRVSATPLIRAAADKAWDAAGRPTDPDLLEQLIKQVQPGLEADRGMHPTTCRIQLRKWAKEHAA